MLCYGQDEMAYHLHPILCTWNAVVTCTPVTVFFPLRVRLCSKKKKTKKKNKQINKKKGYEPVWKTWIYSQNNNAWMVWILSLMQTCIIKIVFCIEILLFQSFVSCSGSLVNNYTCKDICRSDAKLLHSASWHTCHGLQWVCFQLTCHGPQWVCFQSFSVSPTHAQ